VVDADLGGILLGMELRVGRKAGRCWRWLLCDGVVVLRWHCSLRGKEGIYLG